MEDGNDILVEDDIVKAVSFNWVIYGTTDVLVDKENLFFNRALKKTSSKLELEDGKQINYAGGNVQWK